MRYRVVLVFVLLVALGGVAGIVAADDDPAAERALETTTAEPGETVTVTVTIDLPSSTVVDYVEEFDPAFGNVDNLSVRADDTDVMPLFQDFAPEAAILALPESGPGTLTVSYDVTVPEDAEPGTVHGFDGAIQIDDNPFILTGDDELTVAEATTPSPTFDVAIDEDGTDQSVTAGEELAVAAIVENTGDGAGTQSVTFDIDGTEQDSESLSLEPGESETVTFGYETTEDDPPSVEATVATDNDSATTTVSVEPDDADDNGDDADDNGDRDDTDDADDSDDGFGPGFGVVVVVLATVALVGAARYRRRTGRRR